MEEIGQLSKIATAIQVAQAQFEQEGLPFPPVPGELTGDFGKFGEWSYGTRLGKFNLYNLADFVEEVEQGRPPAYLLLGHAGRGIASWAIHYYLVYGPVALFIQSSWGTAYGDEEQQVANLKKRFAFAAQLLDKIEGKQDDFEPGGQWLIVISDFYGSYWKHFNYLQAHSVVNAVLHPLEGTDDLAAAIQIF